MLPVRVYDLGMFGLTICAVAFLWFICNMAFEPIAAIQSQSMVDLGTNSTATDNVREFFSGVSNYLHIYLMFVAGLGTFVAAQIRGARQR